MIVDGWYRAESARAVCGFRVRNGVVTIAAPYIYRMVHGKPAAVAHQVLKKGGFVVTRMN